MQGPTDDPAPDDRDDRDRDRDDRDDRDDVAGDPPPSRTKPKPKKRALPGSGPSRFRGLWIAVAGLYLATVWFDGVGSTWPAKITPRPWLYFSQVAALFVSAAPKVIDYRAEGWSCSEHRWVEIDVRPYFRIDADNKENRFQRALQFYRKNRNVMRALDDFVVKRHNAAGNSIGGVRFSSLRLPYPAPGEHVAPFEQRPLTSYSADQKHAWFWTPTSRRAQRCGAPEQADDDSDRAKDDNKDKDKDLNKDLDP
ncbi:MAG: hypothetical protein QOI41_1520 [Myxococcales bacterium]|nr:hypothetical protein [Myxococcales bacterium]